MPLLVSYYSAIRSNARQTHWSARMRGTRHRSANHLPCPLIGCWLPAADGPARQRDRQGNGPAPHYRSIIAMLMLKLWQDGFLATN
jgi:hypothetical protein